jgi:hypothetical protein
MQSTWAAVIVLMPGRSRGQAALRSERWRPQRDADAPLVLVVAWTWTDDVVVALMVMVLGVVPGMVCCFHSCARPLRALHV